MPWVANLFGLYSLSSNFWLKLTNRRLEGEKERGIMSFFYIPCYSLVGFCVSYCIPYLEIPESVMWSSLHGSLTFHVMLTARCPCAFKPKRGYAVPLFPVLVCCIIPCGFPHSGHTFANSILKLPAWSTLFPTIIMSQYGKWS